MVQDKTSWNGVAFGLALASLAAYQQFKLPPALPVMLDTYGYDRVMAGGFMSIFALVGLFFSLRIGRGLTRRGLWPFLFGAFALFIAGQLLALAAPGNSWLMLLARGLEGGGFAVCAIAGPLIANLNASPAHLPLIIGLTAAWIPIGQISATLLAMLVVGGGGWRLLWWVGIGLTLAMAVWAARLRARGGAITELRRASRGGSGGGPSGAQRRALTVAAAVFGIWSGQYFGYMTWMPQFLIEAHGFDAHSAALAYLVPPALVIVFNIATGIALRAGVPFTPLFVGTMVVQGVLWLLLPFTDSGIAGGLSLIAYGICSGIVPACLFALPNRIMGRGRVDAGAFGHLMTGRNLGVLIGPIALAQAVTWAADWSLVWPLYGVATLVAAGCAAYLGGNLRRLAAADDS